MNLTTDEIAELEVGPPRLGLFLRLDIDPPLRCWLGDGPIKPGITVYDATDEKYFGYGKLLGMPSFQQLINGAGERIDISLSGVDPAILALANHNNIVQDVDCAMGFGIFRKDWQLLGAVHWIRVYTADFIALSVTPAMDPSGQTIKTATLSISSAMVTRKRPSYSYFNYQDQLARSAAINPLLPPDQFFDRIKDYSIIATKTWPRFTP